MNRERADNEERVEQELHNYLLGRLPEAARVRLETRYFADDELFERGWLGAAERAYFERHWLASPAAREQLAFARALHEKLNEPPATPQPAIMTAAPALSRREKWLGFWSPRTVAWATALLLLAGCGWLFFENLRLRRTLGELRAQQSEDARRAEQLQAELVALRAAATPTPQLIEPPTPARTRRPQLTHPTLPALALLPSVRSDSLPEVSLPADAHRLPLHFTLNFDPGARPCTAVLRRAQGPVIARQSGLRARPTGGGLGVTWLIVTTRLKSGEYEATLTGPAANGQAKQPTYRFRVLR
jgi:anti-sigma factor RsiW